MLQYMRKVTAKFNGGLAINTSSAAKHDLKIAFSVEKDMSSTANSATIEIWNLTEGHRNAVGKEFDNIELQAGYMPPNSANGGNIGIIFKGTIKDVEHRREGPDIVTKISCGDGAKALRRAVTSKSFPKGTPVKTVVEELYSQLAKEGIKRGEWKFPDKMEPNFKRPYATCGFSWRELDTIGRGKGFYWSLQNEVMEVIPTDGYVGQMIVLNSQSGLIDCPTITDNGVRVSALLNPEIRPNRRIRVESEVLEMNAANGVYRVGSCTFQGDNRDGEFRVDIHGESVMGAKVNEGNLM